MTDRPNVPPARAFFSSGPCAKRPGWTPDQLQTDVLGRSHRSKLGKSRLKLAIDLTKGDTAAASALATGSVMDTVTKQPVKSVLATPVAIFQSSVKQVISDGFQTKAAVCTGKFAALCTKYGVS